MSQKNNSFKCHKISEGEASGEVLFSKDGICFYLIDPETGVVIQRNHCLFGKSIANKILVFPNGTGSSVVQADGMYQLKMHNNAPRAMIVENADTTLVASSIIMEMPLVDKVESVFKQEISNKDTVKVNATEGVITLIEKED
ncbi:aconitase X swivel domain-containing protein [Liquorilactobacillus uvarum]|uniref:Phosphomevalonate dehydratase small subunit-like domain-containing protein n=1 Tax=Liquorilactobacillus uvarum DSM 19971 TaxID=1423812 RepID=A0A0R1PSP4_9LACO|nr:DUF126 domain-containing protein [Liquorilactobacillus uvarum]KRL33140.1 hypothetical protein FD20_GL002017 [Liquorilactobacillus uvarum DSM 19971]